MRKTYSQRKIEEYIRKTWCCRKKKPVTPSPSGNPVPVDTGCEVFSISFDPERPPSAYNVSIIGEDGIGVFQTDNEGPLVQTTTLPSGLYYIYFQILDNLGRIDVLSGDGSVPLSYTTNVSEPSGLYSPQSMQCGINIAIGIG